jgi:hypothetical protein
VTVRELVRLLHDFPADAEVLIRAEESGEADITVSVTGVEPYALDGRDPVVIVGDLDATDLG